MTNPSKNRGRKKDGPKSRQSTAWSAQGGEKASASICRIPFDCGSRHVATTGGLAGSTGRDFDALFWQLFMGSYCTE